MFYKWDYFRFFKNIVGRGIIRGKHFLTELFPPNISDKEFLRIIGCDADDIIKKKLPPFFFEPEDYREIVDIIRKRYPTSIEKTIEDADIICRHIFDLLGSGKTYLGRDIDWHRDFKTDYRWNPKKRYFESSQYIDLENSADVKVPWELSRCQHLVTLGKAYWYTLNEKYAEEFVSQINNWIERNPVSLGVNWACTMDVAIRAINWLWGYYFFTISDRLTERFRVRFLKTLFLHGRYIINNLEYGEFRGNHYLSDIVGLIYLGIFFRDTEEGDIWLKKGLCELEAELRHQIYRDGVDFEGAIYYHKIVTELFLSATQLCLRNNILFPQWYMHRLEKMLEFILYYTKPDGSAPLIGDHDDGRVHILSNYSDWDRSDHSYLISAGAVVFNRQDFKKFVGYFHEESFWLTGMQGLKNFDKIDANGFDPASRAFPYGGFYIMRDRDLYMIVDCVNTDLKAPTGHRHNSRLSFELFARRKTVIGDPGSYVYTADKDLRNLFRSTGYHNTVVVDDIEQNRFDDNKLFSIGQEAEVRVNRWVVDRGFDILDAEHTGYLRLSKPVIHRRQFYFDKMDRFWLIRDNIIGDGRHRLDIYFHLTDTNIKIDGKEILIYDGFGLLLRIIPIYCHKLDTDIIDGWMSISYGKKYLAPIIHYYGNIVVPAEFVYLLVPGDSEIDRCVEKAQDIVEMFRDIDSSQ